LDSPLWLVSALELDSPLSLVSASDPLLWLIRGFESLPWRLWA
jgi:hypothetical protein